MKNDKDLLAQAIARLKQEGLAQKPPKAVVDETIRRLAEANPGTEHFQPLGTGAVEHRRTIANGRIIGLSLAAAALIALGCLLGRLSGPAPVNVDELREALAASIEPAIRERLIEDLQHRYQLALATTYVKVKEELTEQYRDDMNRFAVQTLAASHAATNQLLAELLAELLENIDTAQTQDLRSVARALYQIELNRVQDKTQLAAGLQTLASRTEDELWRTRREVVQLLGDVRLEDLEVLPARPTQIPNERNEQ